MIFYEGKIYAKVWKVMPSESGKYIDLQVTTSEKDPDGNWINSSWFPRIIGHAVNSLKGIKEGDRIIITKAKLSNERKRQEDGAYRNFFHFVVWEAEFATPGEGHEGNATPTPTKTSTKPAVEETATTDDCPW